MACAGLPQCRLGNRQIGADNGGGDVEEVAGQAQIVPRRRR
ncbi:MAG: hypothetical protein R2856_34785 [Caldilineaceae bacterium]